jgi:hypothetical protein
MTSTVSTKPAVTAGAIFSDQSFFFETLRALGDAPYDVHRCCEFDEVHHVIGKFTKSRRSLRWHH